MSAHFANAKDIDEKESQEHKGTSEEALCKAPGEEG
jgi:hypothetical protein